MPPAARRIPILFLALILVGALLLQVTPSAAPGRQFSWFSSIFTMTSAVCAVGLNLHNTATDCTPLGRGIIALFIQVGGFAYVYHGSLILLPTEARRRRLADIVKAMLAVEVLAAAVMFPLWQGDLSASDRLGHSLFHAVSALCNAGFSSFSDNLTGQRYAMVVHAVIAPLVIVGGLGWPVLLHFWNVARRRPTSLSSPARIILITTFALYLFGTVAITAGQMMPIVADKLHMNVTYNRQAPPELTLTTVGATLADASFLSITARTAGSHTMPIDEVRPAGVFTLVILMTVGGSPGGTAGGMHTFAFAILLLAIFAPRRISTDLLRPAAAVAGFFLLLVAAATLLLCLIEPYPFVKLLFEATSAASSTGLSMGITTELTAFGKCVIVLTMLLGRIAPLMLVGRIAAISF